MKHRESEAIVLEIRSREEADRGVTLLLGSGELVVAHAPAGARSRRRFGGALQPGTKVRARWTHARQGSRAVLAEAEPRRAAPAPDPLERYYGACHLLEMARDFSREGLVDPRVYRLVDRSLEALDGGAPVDALLRYAEAWMLRLAGVLPPLEACEVCGASLAGPGTLFLAPDAGARCAAHRGPGATPLEAGAAAWLRRTRGVAPGTLAPLDTGVDDQLRRALGSLLTAFTGRPLRALQALTRLGRERS
ncbi:MAG: DNA repair protein RecO C-terminal domain-containing protein [Acidobacteriota bacterium]|nr:DNA repair protein RecO C-terminal domain-containing protein [Acidobacteriota bacterium]